MWRVIFSTYKKNRIGIIRAVPWSFMVSRIVTGITQIVFPYFIYYYFMNGNMNKEFGAYAEGADYMTYVVLGSALNVLAVSVLMNIGRALITELREGTLEVLLLSPAPRKNYFVGCLLEQTTRALIEFGTVLVIGALLGANLRYFFSFQTIIVVLLAVLSFFCMGITLSSVMLYTRDTYLTQNTPPELDSYKIINVLEEYGIEISPGIGKLKHSIIRLGTMGTAANTNELEYLDEIVHAKIKALL